MIMVGLPRGNSGSDWDKGTRSNRSWTVLSIIFWFTLGVVVGTTITSTRTSTSLFVQYLKQPTVLQTTGEYEDEDEDEDNSSSLSRNEDRNEQIVSKREEDNKVKQLVQKERMRKYQYEAPILNRTIDDVRSISKASECGIGPIYDDTFFKINSTVRSRLNEDRNIYNLFFKDVSLEVMHQQQYHYVEIGAFDGLGESNTRFYDVCLGWDGLLIEPNPTIYPRLIRNRPYAHRVSFAASCSLQEEMLNTTVGFYAAPFTNAVQDKSANRFAYEGKKQMVQVPCGSLTPVLLNVFSTNKRIHFFSLDTEGVEPMILNNIDFDSIFIDVLISESVNTFCRDDTCVSRNETRQLMVKQHKYDLFVNVIPNSDLFVHPDSEFRSKIDHLTQMKVP